MNTPSIILINPKSPHNVGKALRAASVFGAKSLVWTGTRVDLGQYDRVPREERMKGYASVEFCANDRPFDLFAGARPHSLIRPTLCMYSGRRMVVSLK